MTKIIYEKTSIYEKTCGKISNSIKKILDEKDIVVFGTAGGSSIKKIFNILKNKKINWDKIHFFMVDERNVSIKDRESNFRIINESLKGIIPKENLHPFFYDKKEPLSFYEREFKKYGDRCDIILLSSGEDGHIASLFPDHNSVKNDSDFFIEVENSPKPPSDRMSMSKKMISKSRISYLLIFGDSKKQAYEKYLNKKIDIKKCPSKIVDSIDESYIITDIKK